MWKYEALTLNSLKTYRSRMKNIKLTFISLSIIIFFSSCGSEPSEEKLDELEYKKDLLNSTIDQLEELETND